MSPKLKHSPKRGSSGAAKFEIHLLPYLGPSDPPMSALPFRVGALYHRRQDIHARYKGQQYGGISTPANLPYVFIFSSEAGDEFGYSDGFQTDGTYWYTGEGQVGDMQMAKGNAAILNHRHQGKALLLFEAPAKASKGSVRFAGEMAYMAHHWGQKPDRTGPLRQAVVFHLELLPETSAAPPPHRHVQESAPLYVKRPAAMENLRQQGLRAAPASATVAERLVQVRNRAQAIKAYALARAQGHCEACQQPAPFETRKGPFLEVHHVFRLADGGPDHPDKVVALCPNCHRRAHYAKDADTFNTQLQNWLATHEST